MTDRTFQIVVLPGDGIGVEVTESALAVLDRLIARIGGFRLAFEHHRAGAELYRETGTDLPDPVAKACERADAILFGAMGLPDVRYPDGTEIAPQLVLRMDLDLYAGVRPIRALPGTRLPLADPRATEIDFVLVREQTGNRSLVLFDTGDEVTVQAGEHGIRFLLISGAPLEEPVAWYGPIVMNTQAELRQAVAELRDGSFIKQG